MLLHHRPLRVVHLHLRPAEPPNLSICFARAPRVALLGRLARVVLVSGVVVLLLLPVLPVVVAIQRIGVDLFPAGLTIVEPPTAIFALLVVREIVRVEAVSVRVVVVGGLRPAPERGKK